MSKNRSWTINTMLAEDRNALTVFGVLRGLARGKRQLSPTREHITEVCGLSAKIISRTMKMLDKGCWLKLSYGREGHRTWYRITLPELGWFPVGRKTPYRGEGRRSQNDLQGPIPCGAENDLLPLTGEGAHNAAPYPAAPGGVDVAPDQPQDNSDIPWLAQEQSEQEQWERRARTTHRRWANWRVGERLSREARAA